MSLLNVQYGTGWSSAFGWLNFDASPTLRLERLPLIGRFLRINSERFPDDVLYGDIITGLPVADGSAKAVYASHVLEHLSLDDFQVALSNTYKILAPGGVFRLVVPDLEARVRLYLQQLSAKDPEAASFFLDCSGLGARSRPRGIKGRVRAMFGNSEHLWMWDEPAMAAALSRAGFVDVRRCSFGDAADPAFGAVEQRDRFFFDEPSGAAEVAFEARKPEKTE